jgi:hypothetical protein
MTEVLVGWVGIVIVSSFVVSIHVWFWAWSSGRLGFCILVLGPGVRGEWSVDPAQIDESE